MKNKKIKKGKNNLILSLFILLFVLFDSIVLAKYLLALNEDKNNQNTFEIQIQASDIGLKKGKEINTKIKNKQITEITFGKKSDYLTEIDGLKGEIISTADSKGTAKLYISNDKKAYILAENDGQIYSNADSSKMFSDTDEISNIKKIHFDNLNTSKTTNMSKMFEGCTNLEEIDLSKFDTSKVTNMQGMFDNCRALSSINVSSFNTNNVTDMQGMFWNCFTLTNLDIRNFNTKNVLDMSYFLGRETNKGYETNKLLTINLGQLDTSKVTNMNFMFSECSGLTQISTSSFNTENVLTMTAMFKNCKKLTEIDTNNFKTSKVTDMQSMFEGCESLVELNLTNFDTSNVTNMSYMFRNCKNILSFDISNFETSKVTDMQYMLSGLEKITVLNLKEFNTKNVTSFVGMFTNDYELTTIYTSEKFIVSTVSSASDENGIYIFNGCDKLIGKRGTALKNIKASGVTDEEIYGKRYAWMDGINFLPGYFTDTYNEKLTIKCEEQTVELGQTLQLSAKSTKTDSTIKWSSADRNIATIDDNGLITAVNIGKVKITAQGSYNEEATIEIEVTPLKYSHTISVTPTGSTIIAKCNGEQIATGTSSVTVKVLPNTTISYEVSQKYYQKKIGDIVVSNNNETTIVELESNPTNIVTIVPSSVEGTEGIRDMEMACRKAEKDSGTKQYAYCKKSGEFTFTWVFKPESAINSEAKITAVTTYANMCYNSALYTDKTGVYVTVSDNSGNTSFSYTTDANKIDEERIKVGNTQKIISCYLSTIPTVTQINEGIKYSSKRGTTKNHNLNWYGAHIEVSYINP